MSLAHGTSIIKDGLMLYLDAANVKSYNPNLVTTLGSHNYTISGAGTVNPVQYDYSPFYEYIPCKYDLTGRTSPYLNVRVDTPLEAGQYTISCWFKGTTNFSANFALIGETVGETPNALINITTSWQRFTYTLNLANAQTAARIQLFFSTQGEGKIISIYGAQVVKGSSALDYKENLGNNGNILRDLSGNGRNGAFVTPSGINYTTSNRGCLDFSPGSYITVPHDAQISSQVFGTSNNFTLAAWFNIRNYINYAPIIQKATAGSYSNSTVGIWAEATNEIRLVIGANVDGNPSGSTTFVNFNATPNEWYNAVAVGAGTSALLYINGSLIGSTPFSDITVTRSENTSPITIGTRAVGQPPQLDGLLSHVSVYGRTLSASEVAQNFNALRGRFGL